MKIRSAYYSGFLLCVLIGMSMYMFWGTSSAKQKPLYLTHAGTGPDKWASIWLIERTGAGRVNIIDEDNAGSTDAIGSKLGDAVAGDANADATWFDTPNSEFQRTGSSTTLDALLLGLDVKNPQVLSLAKLVYEIEIGAWRQGKSLQSDVVELGFRGLQTRFGRTQVPRQCYMAFFDSVANELASGTLTSNPDPTRLIQQKACTKNNELQTQPLDTTPEFALNEVLARIAAGDNVVFLDTREASEFNEVRIPGAQRIPLRDIQSSVTPELLNADLVIAYCVKDFRGYEVASKLRSFGVNAVIMRPYGIRGWLENKLPVAGDGIQTDMDAYLELLSIARQT